MTTATPPLLPSRSRPTQPGAGWVSRLHNTWKNTLAPSVRDAFHESRWLVAAAAAQLIGSGIICGLADRPMLAGPLDAYSGFLWAASIFATMAIASELF